MEQEWTSPYEANAFPVALDHSWPGLEPPPPGESELDPDELLNFADKLDDEANRLVEANSALHRLSAPPGAYDGTGRSMPWWFGEWDTGFQAKHGLDEARRLVLEAANYLIEEMRNAAAEARFAAAEVMDEEDARRLRLETLNQDAGSTAIPVPGAGHG